MRVKIFKYAFDKLYKNFAKMEEFENGHDINIKILIYINISVAKLFPRNLKNKNNWEKMPKKIRNFKKK